MQIGENNTSDSECFGKVTGTIPTKQQSSAYFLKLLW